MMPVNSGSLFGGLVGLVIVVAILALVAGLALSNNDLLNPTTSDAIARERNQATQSKSQKDEIDLAAYQAQKAAETEKTNLELENYRTIQAARTQAEQDKARLEVEARKRELEQTLAQQRAQAEQGLTLARQTHDALLTGGTWTLLILSVGTAAFLGQLGYSRLALARAQATRIQMIAQARAREIEYREAELVQAGPKPITSGNGKHPPEPIGNTMKRVA